ncbi:MAG TPA: dTMP kinase [Hyphomonas sp.]|nr:dTMP kinase [Hyphomonas sp.]HPE48264.1 dTMP kinase [Hyphomonas sp.]
MRGRFITLEGGEGSGKSTLLKELAARLEAAGKTVVCTREPGGTALAESVRNLVLHPPAGQHWSPMAEALLMNTARTDHLEKLIRPALERGDWVLCDRFADSTRVYQSVSGGVSEDVLKLMEGFVVGETRPDMTLVLDAPVEAAAERREARAGTADTFEARGHEFHEKVRAAFLRIAQKEPARCVLIDASRQVDEVANAAWTAVQERLDIKAPATT